MYAVVDPVTGETLKEYPTITDDDLRSAIGRADEAHRGWSASSSVADRAALVRRVGELHKERTKELAEIIVREMGKPIEQAIGEVDFAGDIYAFYADNADTIMADEPIELMGGEGSALVRRTSYGVLLGIMPWNFPYYQVARFAGPNLVIGNTVLLKHAPQCPESAEAMAKINAYNGGAEFNARKPYSINKYGLLEGRGLRSAADERGFPGDLPDAFQRRGLLGARDHRAHAHVFAARVALRYTA